MQYVNLTEDLFLNSRMCSKDIPDGITLIEEMLQCIKDDWSPEMYIGYLSQFFILESIPEVIKPHWNIAVDTLNK